MNIVQHLENCPHWSTDKPALIFEGQEYSYHDLAHRSNQIAQELTELGLSRGDRVALYLPNSPDYIWTYLGILRLGAVAVSINIVFQPAEVQWLLQDCGAKVVVTTAEGAAKIRTAAPTPILLTETQRQEWLGQTGPISEVVDLGRDAAAVMLYTSGTTGVPKGAVLSHGNLSFAARQTADTFQLDTESRLLLCLPLYHSFGQTTVLLPSLLAGATLILARDFELEKTLGLIQAHQVTHFFGVPTIYQVMAEAPPESLRSVRHFYAGAATLPQALSHHWQEKFGILLQEKYGSTETSLLCVNPAGKHQVGGSVGIPLPGIAMKLVNDAGNEVGLGETGEVVVHGPNVMCGYWNRPEETAQVLKAGWFYTGDIGRSDDAGYLYLVERRKDLINVGGEKVYPAEVEQVISQHPAIAEVAVYGVPELLLGEQVQASIVLKSGTAVTAAEIIAYCQQRLADFKIPSGIAVVDKLPKGNTGKILKKVLREQFQATLATVKPRGIPELITAETLQTWLIEWLSRQLALAADQIDRDKLMFDYGVNSIKAVMLAHELSTFLGKDVPATLVLKYPTIERLAAHLVEEWTKYHNRASSTTRLPTTDSRFPLSYNQQALWFIYQQQALGSKTAYNTALALTITGELDVLALQRALQSLVNRHPALRTTIAEREGQPMQEVQPIGQYRFTQHDLTGWPEATLLAELDRIYKLPFDLSQAPTLRVDLFSRAAQSSILLLTIHHIFTDATSAGILLKELLKFYHGEVTGVPVSLSPLSVSYADYVHWETEMLSGTQGERLATYWHQQLAGEIPILNLPTDHPRPPVQTYNGASHRFQWTASLSQSLKTLAQEHETTVFAVLLSAFKILLHRYTGQPEIWIGVPVTIGRQTQFAKVVGYLVNTVVLRANFEQPTLTFNQLLSHSWQTLLDALEHQDHPLPILVKVLSPQRDASYTPLFQVMFNFESTELIDRSSLSPSDNLTVTVFEMDQQEGLFDLSLDIIERENLVGSFRYNRDLFEPATIARMVGHFETLLKGIVVDPDQLISQLPLLTDAELQQLQAWNDTAVDYPQDLTIVDLFEQQVARTPNHIAVVFENQQLTYQQLNDQANQLAHYLLARQTQAGIPTHNPLIAIAVERSLEMVIGLLGILKAGGAYVPIDPSYPRERIRYLLEDSAAPLLLTQSHLQAQLPTLEPDGVVVCVDEAKWADQPTTKPAVKSQAEDLAYVIYTSGSTGKPKGVMVEHKGLVNLALSQINAFRIVSESRILQFASFSFDAAVSEMITTLLSGAALYLVLKARLLETAELMALVVQEQISHLTLPPTLLSNLPAPACSGLKTLVVAGEACSIDLVKQWANRVHFINAYGPTENTVCATMALGFSEMESPHIGKPIANTRIYILDAQHQPQPPGLPGELCIAGRGLARGYLHRPELTAEKFIEVELFGKPERVYKTGDLARWLPDGNLEYLGRLDHQVKLRGFRIELGEIEAVLSQHDAVNEAVVTLNEAEGNPRLVAYLTTAAEVPPAVLKEWLTARLPDYMVPSQFVVLEQLPLTPNGKIDRQALPAPEANILTANTLPRDTAELQLLAIWETVLEVHSLGIHDNFFDLGGHSLLAVKLMSHIQQQCGVRLPVSVLFQSPTVATLAPHLRPTATPPWRNLVPIQTAGEANPIYCLPGAVGSVMYLYPLASSLGPQQPCYALPTPGLDGSPTPATVASLARAHLQAVRQHQPTGPYQLIGHSAGGRVAFEMAWQLEQQGETVAFLAILDTSAPDSKQPNPTAAYTEINWLAEIVLVFEELTGLALNLSLEQLQRLPDLETAYTQVMQAFQQRQILFAPKAPVAELKAWVNTYRLTVQGQADYQIPGKLRAPIHLFRAQEHLSEEMLGDTRDAWGWTECTHAKVIEHGVPGTHVTMMTLPHVKTLAAQLSQSLPPGKRKDLAG